MIQADFCLENSDDGHIQRCFTTVAPGRAYQHNWHIDAVAWHLQECYKGRIKRLIITLPLRSLKSICASVAFPAWALGWDPTLRFICVSYSNELTRKHALDCRAVMESNWYRRVLPRTPLHPEKNTELEFMTTRRGFRLGTSVGGTLTGKGGNFIVIDDPMKPLEATSKAERDAVKQWYGGTLYSRLDDKAEDVIILIMQRLHVDDLVAHVVEKEPWLHLELPAIAEVDQRVPTGPDSFHDRRAGDGLHPEYESRETLEQIKANLGSHHFSAQYQQNPVPPGGGMIKREWLRFYRERPPRSPNDQIVQSWDTASKATEISDYSVGMTWHVQDRDYYLLDVVRERLEYPFLKKRVVEWHQKHTPDALLIEDKGSGTSLIQDLEQEGIRPIGITPEQDKVTRMSAQSARIQAGYVWLPERAPWLQDFQTEILQFPYGRHDDQVDAMSQFLGWISDRPPPIECW